MDIVPTHTDESRELLVNGQVKPGDKALDVPVESMSNDEVLREILIHQRNVRDTVNGLVAAIGASPMGKVLMNGGTPLGGGLFGGNSTG